MFERRSRLVLRLLLVVILSFVSAVSFGLQEQEREEPILQEQHLDLLKPQHVYRFTIPANVDWTDTGLRVFFGQRIRWRAYGGISLQKGNPMAYCGPDGYSLLTVQQPIRDRNIGALIGKIVKLVSIEIDKETEEEKRIEEIEYFYIGSNSTVLIPLEGHLFLGINELLTVDNTGEFNVTFYSPGQD